MTVMHIDANSAFLSWSAAAALERGETLDFRSVPAVVGGNEKTRHGIVLAKSIPAKKYGIITGESLMEARKKCPGLLVIPPDYDLYMDCSNAMYSVLSEYSPRIYRYSIDECFMDYTASEAVFGDPVETAYAIKDRIKNELGFTVNVGVSVNKILAKMGSELKKPDMVHTLYPEEIAEKMWPLPVGELFMVGRSSRRRLEAMNIRTIGDLAHADRRLLRAALKSHGDLIWRYANGIDDEPVGLNDDNVQKGVGNSMTIDHDVFTAEEARRYLLSLAEKVSFRLRKMGCQASLFSVWIRSFQLEGVRHQVQTDRYTDITKDIYETACMLFDSCWNGEPIRQLGIGTGNLCSAAEVQLSLFDSEDRDLQRRADRAVDSIRLRFGTDSIQRAVFVNTPYRPVEGGVNGGNYIMMGGHKGENSSQTS